VAQNPPVAGLPEYLIKGYSLIERPEGFTLSKAPNRLFLKGYELRDSGLYLGRRRLLAFPGNYAAQQRVELMKAVSAKAQELGK
jgi:hypothetical protein